MNRVYLTNEELPFCKGCGHATIAENTDKALQKLGLSVLDVIVVTDIGCHGIIDKSFNTHTFHGLHGRSVALASGLSAALNNPDKKVIVFIGDGGATIGMQHLIDAAHRNFNMTVVIHNNFLYGMTGGQPSGFTPLGFKTPTLPEGASHKGMDMCNIVTAAGANYVSRIIGIGDISDALATAISKNGFSLLEIMEICPSYGVKSNPGMKLSKTVEEAGLPIKIYADKDQPAYITDEKTSSRSLIDSLSVIETKYTSNIKEPLRLMMSGSAGESIQMAAEFFAKAAMSAGLHVTKKGSYPVTVGIGFSSSDVIISPEPILYTGSTNPDVMIITSKDGLDYSLATLKNMDHGILLIDTELPLPETKAKLIQHDFRSKATPKYAAIYALLYYLKQSQIFPVDALAELIKESRLSAKLDVDKLL